MNCDEKEILRYLGVKTPDPDLSERIQEAIGVTSTLFPLCTHAVFDVEEQDGGVFLRGTDVLLSGNLAKKHFHGCKKIIVMLATLGLKSEVVLKRVFSVSAEKGVILDATYTEALEKYLDEQEAKLQETYGELTSRISCGYGDLPLRTQRPLFDLLDGGRLGVKLNECFMLTPNKSVIALVGVR